jgi:hypothetical protein
VEVNAVPNVRQLVLGFYRTDPYVPQLMDTALVAVFHAWCRREGYELGVPYRAQDDSDGAFYAMLQVLRDREDVAGVLVPTLAHLAPADHPALEPVPAGFHGSPESRRDRIAATGKALFVAYP